MHKFRIHYYYYVVCIPFRMLKLSCPRLLYAWLSQTLYCALAVAAGSLVMSLSASLDTD